MRSDAPPPSPGPVSMAALLAAGPLLLDGAMGTELDARGVDTAHSLWSALALLEAPEQVRAVHEDYLAAGARVITTNSYQASPPAFARAGFDARRAHEALVASARIATEAAARHRARGASGDTTDAVGPIIVAGDLGPYGAFLADGSEYTGAYSIDDPDFEDVHRSRIEALAGRGLDVFALETMPRLDEARAVAAMVRQTVPDAECWVSFQVRPDGTRLADGTPLAEAAAWADRADGVVAVGVNCVAAEVVDRALPVLRGATDKPLVAYPNSGDVYDPATKTWREVVGRERFTASVPAWLQEGVRLVGGCCRTTPADTTVLADLVAEARAAD